MEIMLTAIIFITSIIIFCIFIRIAPEGYQEDGFYHKGRNFGYHPFSEKQKVKEVRKNTYEKETLV